MNSAGKGVIAGLHGHWTRLYGIDDGHIYGPAKTAVGVALRQMTDLLAISSAMAIQGKKARGQVKTIASHLARLLALPTIGGHPPGDNHPPKKNDRDDKHWWDEIKGAMREFLQATKGASSKQVMRELLKHYNNAQIAEIEAALARAETMMGENVGKLVPPQ